MRITLTRTRCYISNSRIPDIEFRYDSEKTGFEYDNTVFFKKGELTIKEYRKVLRTFSEYNMYRRKLYKILRGDVFKTYESLDDDYYYN